ncbi:UNVERIFIED_CONTAM: UPF0761 membrane protein [Trichonephila clavipes]
MKRSFGQRLRNGIHVLRLTVQHFLRDDCRQHAAALTYTTLFAVVPVMTVVFTLLAAIPSLQHVSGEIQNFIFENLVPSAGTAVQTHIAEFSQKASQLTVVGIIVLFVTAIMMLMTIERAFNDIWQVRAPRGGFISFLRYWAVISLGPLLLGAGFLLSSYLMSLRVFSDTADLVGAVAPGLGLVPMLFTALGFTLLYTTVPNCRVPLRAGLISGFVAAGLFELAKRAFGLFVSGFSSYELVYGAFAAFPVFLLWIFLSWLIILFGVELSRGLVMQESVEAGHRHPVLTLLSLLALLHQRQVAGEGVREVEAMRLVGRQQVDWGDFSRLLQRLRLVRVTREGDLVLARDLTRLDLLELYRQLPWPLPTTDDLAAYPDEPWHPALAALLAPVEQGMDAGLRTPLAELLGAVERRGENRPATKPAVIPPVNPAPQAGVAESQA